MMSTTKEIISVKHGINGVYDVRCAKSGMSIHFKTTKDRNDNTVEFVLYKHNDGFRFRRIMRSTFWLNNIHYYQMFRNSHTNDYEKYWPAFKTIYEAIARFNKYLAD